MTSTPGSVEAKEQETVEEQNGMLASLEELLGGAESTLTLRNGKTVEVPPAKVKQLKQVTAFITEFVSNFEEASLVQLIMKVSARQESAIAAGTSPFALHTNDIVAELAGEAGILMQVLNGGLGKIGELVTIFSNVTEDEFDELELDEAGCLLVAIFGRNYAFFTRQVRPLIQGSIARLMRKASQTQGKEQKQNSQQPRKA